MPFDSTLIPSTTGLPDTNAADVMSQKIMSNSNTSFQDIKDQVSLQNQFPAVTVNGQTLSDLVNQVNSLQQQNQQALNQSGTSGGYFDVEKATDNLFNRMNSQKSFGAQNTPVNLGEGKDFERYYGSKNFKTFGYTPGMGEGQEYKYGNAMTWGDTIGRALAGGGHLAYDTFVEGWKGWGRMAEALFTWDSSKLMGSQEEREEMARHQEEIMNKYAIYDTETSKDGYFNRQFFGNMLQQSGFAVGAGLQFAAEEFLTAGLATPLEGALKGSMLARAARTSVDANGLINDTRKVMNTVTASERVTNGISGIARKLVPLYGTAEDIVKMGKAGAGGMQMAMTGLGGIRRSLSEFNMSRSESIYEAASTYTQLKDRLVEDFVNTNGRQPSNEELEKIKQYSEDAAHDNFWTNVGVLSVMNRIEFDNMFNSFKKGRNIFNESASHLGEEAFTVTGKIEGKAATRAYEKSWFFGRLGAVKDIAKDFGRQKAAWEATKMLGKGLTKIEGSEGVQELLQNASDKGLEDYYYDLYHGKKGYTGRLGSVLDSIENPLTSTEGMKTFLMGALTGAIISPGAKVIGRAREAMGDAKRRKADPNYKSNKEQVEENLHLVNQLYKDPTQFKKEWIANTKVQNKAAETMEEAVKNHNQYVFNNAKDSAFAKTVASAIKLNMFDSIRDTLKEYGDTLSDEDFKKAFDLDPNSENRKDVKSFMTNIGNQMEDYYITFNNLKDKYGDRVLPELYKNNTDQEYAQARLSKHALDDAIEILATNVYKSKQAVKRASNLQTELASNKNIGGSSIEILSKMGSEQAIEDTINLLEKNIKDQEKFVSDGGTLTKEQKEKLREDKEELEYAKTWKESHADIVNNSDESYSPAAEKRAYKAYADLINLYNKRAKNTTVVTKEDVDDNFVKIIDYIKLNKDHRAYVDAMNLLADPYNMKLITKSMISAHRAVNETFKQEHKQEVKSNGGTEEDVHDDDIEELSKLLKGKEKKEQTDLENFLQQEYNKAKQEAEKQGTSVPDYETWKKTVGVGLTKQFEEAKKSKEEPSPKGGVPKGTIKVNGKIITMEGVDGTIDFTGALKGTDMTTMMPEITQLIKNWDKDFVSKNLVNYNGQFLFNYQDRVFVLMQVGKFIVPYYFSSKGTSGKAIDWHYVFGVDDASNWIIKGGVDEKGEVVYGKKLREKYPKAIAELERLKTEIRTKLAMTTDERDSVVKQLKSLKTKYPKSLDTIYKGFDVVEGYTKDGIETNDDYIYLVNATLGLTGMDREETPPPGPTSKTEKTYTVRKDDETRKWYVVDQDGNVVAKDFSDIVKANEYIKNISKPAPESSSNIEAKKADIERRRQEELAQIPEAKIYYSDKIVYLLQGITKEGSRYSTGNYKIITTGPELRMVPEPLPAKSAIREVTTYISLGELKTALKNTINAKYDAELATLEGKPSTGRKAELEKLKKFIESSDVITSKMDDVYKVIDKDKYKDWEGTLDIDVLNEELASVLDDIDPGDKNKVYNAISKYLLSKFIDEEIKNLKEEEEEKKIEIEPEAEFKDYDKVYNLAKRISTGENVNTPESSQLVAKYPKVLQEFIKIENKRQEDLKNNPSKADEINKKYNDELKNLIDTYGSRINKEDVVEYGSTVSQGLDRNKKAQMLSDALYASKEYQEDFRQIYPSNSLGNKTDEFIVDQTETTVTYTRTGKVNPNYVFDVATQEFPRGTKLIYKVITDQADYDKMGPNRLTGEKYERSKIFDKNGKVKQDQYDAVPIGVYSVIRGKEMLIGTVHEPLWIGYKISGKHPNIATPEGAESMQKHVESEIQNNKELRKKILDAFNKDSKALITGVVLDKSIGVLKLLNDPGLLKDRVNPKIGEGGIKNRHGYFAIGRNGTFQSAINVDAENVKETENFTKNMDKYSGIPVLMLPTSTGEYFPTFVGLPKINKGEAEFILESWRAFTGKTNNPDLVEAVYKAVGREMSGTKPDVNVLSEYLNQYYVHLNHDEKLSSIGNGSDVKPGDAMFDIDAFGNIKLEVKDAKTQEWVSKTIRSEKDVPANMVDLLQNLRTTIKFSDRRNDSLLGINSKDKITFLTMENGKLSSKQMTYNQHLLEKATTFVEKGTQSENTNKDWVYFANPVVKMTLDEIKQGPSINEMKETPPTSEDLDSEHFTDLGEAFYAALMSQDVTDDQIKEEKEKCNPTK